MKRIKMLDWSESFHLNQIDYTESYLKYLINKILITNLNLIVSFFDSLHISIFYSYELSLVENIKMFLFKD